MQTTTHCPDSSLHPSAPTAGRGLKDDGKKQTKRGQHCLPIHGKRKRLRRHFVLEEGLQDSAKKAAHGCRWQRCADSARTWFCLPTGQNRGSIEENKSRRV